MINIAEMMADPDFLSELPVQVIHRGSAVNNHGEGVLFEAAAKTIPAIVQPASGNVLMRLPEAARLKQTIRVWCAEPLQVESVSGYADILLYKGRRWIVTVLDDYSTWGYSRALAQLEGVSN
jgi:hypothetical protein